MSVDMTKKCETCGITIYKKTKESKTQWINKRFCSRACLARSTSFTPLHLRFWKYVVKGEKDKCWVWSGPKDIGGYGALGLLTGQKAIKAHRLSYEMFNGAIPDGHLIRHKCDNPPCVNPHHLETGTQKDNAMDMSKRGRMNPKSFLNLRPGQKGIRGAGEKSNLELMKNG